MAPTWWFMWSLRFEVSDTSASLGARWIRQTFGEISTASLQQHCLELRWGEKGVVESSTNTGSGPGRQETLDLERFQVAL